MKIVVMGCGRVGARLARLFEREGHDVSVIDLYPESFARLGTEFKGTTLAGTGIDEDVLKAAGIQHADIFLAVTQQDNANIMAAQIAKLMFQVPRVIARIYEPDREETFHQMGLETICPTTLVSNRIYKAVSTGIDAHIQRVDPGSLPAKTAEAPAPNPVPAEAMPLPTAAPVANGARLGSPAPIPPTPPVAQAEAPAGDRQPAHLGNSLRQRFFR